MQISSVRERKHSEMNISVTKEQKPLLQHDSVGQKSKCNPLDIDSSASSPSISPFDDAFDEISLFDEQDDCNDPPHDSTTSPSSTSATTTSEGGGILSLVFDVTREAVSILNGSSSSSDVAAPSSSSRYYNQNSQQQHPSTLSSLSALVDSLYLF